MRLIFLAGIFIGAATIMIATTLIGHHWDREIINQGCGSYDSVTKKFQWNDKKKDINDK